MAAMGGGEVQKYGHIPMEISTLISQVLEVATVLHYLYVVQGIMWIYKWTEVTNELVSHLFLVHEALALCDNVIECLHDLNVKITRGFCPLEQYELQQWLFS